MKYVYHLAALSAVALLCAGCYYPRQMTTSPGASGEVLDAKTLTGVSGAYVEVSNSRRVGWQDDPAPTLDEALANARTPSVKTGTNGDFYIPRESVLILNSSMEDWHAYGTLIILKDGYAPGLFPISDVSNLDEQSTTYLLKRVGK
jgi:hypothetical protein